jgi:hypothetical protein
MPPRSVFRVEDIRRLAHSCSSPCRVRPGRLCALVWPTNVPVLCFALVASRDAQKMVAKTRPVPKTSPPRTCQSVTRRLAAPSRLRRCPDVAGKMPICGHFAGSSQSLNCAAALTGRCSAVLARTTELADLQVFPERRSPLTDSNRRPPPYHGGLEAVLAGTPGHKWTRSSCKSGLCAVSLVSALARACSI